LAGFLTSQNQESFADLEIAQWWLLYVASHNGCSQRFQVFQKTFISEVLRELQVFETLDLSVNHLTRASSRLYYHPEILNKIKLCDR